MLKTKRSTARHTSDRNALRRRIGQLYEGFNGERWDKCYSVIDPRLRDAGKVDLPDYVDRLKEFKEVYGRIKPWHVRVSLHLDAKANKQDGRPFAYVYVVWQDDANEFHMFRERWVKDGGRWFTRVVGLVPNRNG